jgi:hypothetical protein
MSRLLRAPGAVLAAACLKASAAPARARREARVHAVRVASRHVRSLWRLLKFTAGARASRRQRRTLSRAARFLAAPRERDALRVLARKLARSEKELAVPLSAFLRRLPPPRDSASIERKLDLASAAIEHSAVVLARTALSARRADVRRGLKSLKRTLRRARRRAVRRGAVADLHACRKRAKDLKFIFEVFDLSKPAARRYRKAAEKLGTARDLRALSSKAGLRDGCLVKKARKLESAALSRL